MLDRLFSLAKLVLDPGAAVGCQGARGVSRVDQVIAGGNRSLVALCSSYI